MWSKINKRLRTRTKDRNLLSICLLLCQGKKEGPGGEVIIALSGFVFWPPGWPGLVLSELGDKISEKLSGVFQDSLGDSTRCGC